MSNIFKEIVKKGLMFSTGRGMQSPQALYTLPLTGNNGFNLDEISKDLLRRVRSVEEESLVSESKADPDDLLRLDVIKEVIADKQMEAKEAKEFAEKQAKIQKLLAQKARLQDKELGEMSMEDVDTALEELKGK